MQLNTLEDLFADELKDVYHSELQLNHALPAMIKASSCVKLRTALEGHLVETHTHVVRLEQVFNLLNLPVKAKKCSAMEGILKETEDIFASKIHSDEIRDILIICMGQKIEHYEMASYGTVCAWAEVLGHHAIVKLLVQTLNEETRAEEHLSELATNKIKAAAIEMHITCAEGYENSQT